MSDSESSNIAITPNQKAFSSSGSLIKYIKFVSGDTNIIKWLLVEVYYLFFAPLPGFLGIFLRTLFLPIILKSGRGVKVEKGVVLRSPNRISLSKSCIIDQGVTLDARNDKEILLGKNCFVGAYSMILAKGGSISLGDGANVSSYARIASEGEIVIGNSVLISAYCYIGPGNHRISDSSIPIMEQGMEEGRGVLIGENTWIGAHSTILDGVKIGRNVVVGAHSLVKSDVPDNAIVGGVPAKIIKMRN